MIDNQRAKRLHSQKNVCKMVFYELDRYGEKETSPFYMKIITAVKERYNRKQNGNCKTINAGAYLR